MDGNAVEVPGGAFGKAVAAAALRAVVEGQVRDVEPRDPLREPDVDRVTPARAVDELKGNECRWNVDDG